MKKTIFIFLLGCSFSTYAQVELNPNSVNAELRVNSTTKGILLPRINSPNIVSSPQEGLLIYDKSTKAPAFHDGTQWNSMMMMPSVVKTDSLSYSFLTGFGPLFLINNPLPMLSLSTGGSYPGPPGNISWQSFSFSKNSDRNTIGLLNIFGNKSLATTMVLEVKVYKKGTSLPYFSYKFSNIYVSSVQFGASTVGTSNTEFYSIEPKIYAWKDHVSGFSIGFDTITGTQVAY